MNSASTATRAPGPTRILPADDSPVSVHLLGTQTRFVHGRWSTHRVIEHGEGPPLLLLHGIGGHAEVWARNIKRLGEHFHVYAVDMLHHGYSSKDPWRDDLVGVLADALIDLMDALGHPTFAVEGESLGAGVAFDLAMRWPDRVTHLVCNTGFGLVALTDGPAVHMEDAMDLSRRSQAALADGTTASLRHRLEWLVHDPASITDEMVALRQALYADPGINESLTRVNGFTKSMPAPRWTEADVAASKVPALVLWTEHNPIQKPDYGRYVASLLSHGRFHCIDGVGHWPQWEAPTEHDAVVTSFLLDEEGN